MKNFFLQYKSLICAFIVLFNLCYSLFFIFFGLDLQDGFYHINRMISNDPYVMTFLTYKIGYLWFIIFGKSVLGFRVFNVIIYQLIVYAPIFLIDKKENKYKFIFFSFILNFFISLLNWNLLGYDSFSFLFVIYALVFFIKYNFERNNLSLLLFSVFSVFAVASRLPNILIIPIFSFLLIISKENNQKINSLIKFICAFFLMFILLVAINYGSLQNYLIQLKNSFNITNEDHGLKHLVYTYINHFFKICKYLAVLFVFYWLYIKTENKKKLRYLVYLLSVFPFFLFLKFIFLSGFNTKMALLFGVIMLALLILEFKCDKSILTITSKKVMLLSIFLIQFLPSAGSNSGLKYIGIFIVFFSYIYFQSQLKTKKYLFYFLIFLLPFIIFEKIQIKFMDENFSKLNKKLEVENLQSIKTTKERDKFINEVISLNEVEVNKGNNVIVYGINAHIFNYLLFNSKALFKSFPMKLNNKDEFSYFKENYFKNNQPVVILVPIEIHKNKLSYFESELIKLGYNRTVQDDYILLKPNEI